MEKRSIAGIKRRKEFSPNHVDNDAAIFALCVEALQKNGFNVNSHEEDDFLINYSGEKLIFHMARHHMTLQKLKELEQAGCKVINTTYGIENGGREQITKLFFEANIPQPRSVIISTDPIIQPMPFPKLWIKCCDAHTVIADDVCFADNEADFKRKLAGFTQRDIYKVVINEHLEGDLVKFYGVTGTSFFHWFYPNEMNHSKFGQEAVNGKPQKLAFNETDFAEICHRAATVLQLDIWGGDAIISKDGTFRIIDFNDFPSFRPCREEAAEAIADRVSWFAGSIE